MAQHLSIRIPWKDNGYDGLVCNKPCYNTSCLRLKNIAESRDDEKEKGLAGSPILGHEKNIPCVSEGACFMSKETYKTYQVHPYKQRNPETHGHFLETELSYLPYSFPSRPYGWMLRSKTNAKKSENIEKLHDKYGVDFNPEFEPELPFDTYWVQDARNQRAIFDAFYENVEPFKSLVIPYVKQVPFIDDSKRVVMGVGYVTSVVLPPEHNHTNASNLSSMLWETMLGHSIREDRTNGFLLPYREMMEYAKTHPDFDLSSIAVLVDDEYFEMFSYAAEHISYDAVISVLLQIINSLKIIKGCIPGDWDKCITWVRQRIDEVWLERGLFPGLGSMLHAIGFKSYEVVATLIKKKIPDESDFETEAGKIILDPGEYLEKSLSCINNQNGIDTYASLSKEERTLFWLLARMSITDDQAYLLFNSEIRRKNRIELSDEDIIGNPYSLYEKTRLLKSEYGIAVKTVDMAVFPAKIIRDINPLLAPSALKSENDERRIRAYIISILEKLALIGNTVYPMDYIIDQLNQLPIDPPVRVTGVLLNGKKSFFETEISVMEGEDNLRYYQLKRMTEFDSVIRNAVKNRLSGKRHIVIENWGRFVDDEFSRKHISNFIEKNIAREERVAILKEIAESRLSVLIGGAGTGKTTLLALLCKSRQISNGGVLLLAPTGKARVRIAQAMAEHGIKCKAQTIAQFLIENDRFDGEIMQYRLSQKDAINVPSTVIIDESSMLTEEMFAAIMQAVKNAQRVVFVGDPNQLPPIGAGRPFVDLVGYLKRNSKKYPYVAPAFGELTVNMRQLATVGETREDTELAKWYTSNPSDLDDSIFINLQSGKLGSRVAFVKWSSPEDLEKSIFKVIADETCMNSPDDVEGFCFSLGGVMNGEWMNFGSKPEKVEEWQILSPYRNDAEIGSSMINRYIHERYRSQEMQRLTNCKIRGTKYLLGTDGVMYGEKVINVRNQKKRTTSRKDNDGYVANGEVGIVEKLWHNEKPYTHQIRFSSQPDCSYKWYSSVSDEGNSDIELAYALTVHKSQGSEFGKAFLVLSEPCRMLSKELLYTAITRQKDKLIILYNDDAHKLRDYTSSLFSEVAKRLTCLFKKPKLIEYKSLFFEESLIHMTLKGHLVRSKSEVIISNMLYQEGIDYKYEDELDLNEDGKLYPDFTIRNEEKGICVYWEHCGMLGNLSYSKRWEEKKMLYRKHGIIEGKNLFVSKDSLNGAIDSSEIHKIIDSIKSLIQSANNDMDFDFFYDYSETYENSADICLDKNSDENIDNSNSSYNGSYDLDEDLIPEQLRDCVIDLPVSGDIKGWFYLVCYEGKLNSYTDKKTERMYVPVVKKGIDKKISVSVVKNDRIIYIPQNMFDLYEKELGDPDGILLYYHD